MNIQSRVCEITRRDVFRRILGALLLMPPASLFAAQPDEIKRQPVESSVLASAGYDAQRRMLEIEFHSGAIYRYLDVTEDLFRKLLAAESKGQFFGTNIRNKFRSELVKPKNAK
jgi:hypothetical protein